MLCTGAHNTRFLVLPQGEGIPNLASRVLAMNLRRLSGDWQAAWGHPLELAETFVASRLYRGTCYRAANWIAVGQSKGYARSNGRYTDKHGERKQMLVYPLRRGARERLADPADRPEWVCQPVAVHYGEEDLRSLRQELEEVEDSRSRYGKRHALGAVLALLVLARRAGKVGGRAAEAYCKTLKPHEMRALGCRWDERERRYVTPSDTTFQRVMERTDPASLERVIQRWTQPRASPPAALAGDGKRIRGANRMAPQGEHWETVTLVDHASGAPVASRSYREEGGEQHAMRALLEEVDLRGVTVTLDAGHAGREIQQAIVEQHGGHIVEIQSVRTSFSRINSAAGEGLFSVYSDAPEDLDRAGSDARSTSRMAHGARCASQVPVETFTRRNLDRSLRIEGSQIL